MKGIFHYILPFVVWSIVSCSPMNKANKSFEKGEYSDAIYLYEKKLKKDDTESNYNLAESYRVSNQLKKSEPYYKAALGDSTKEDAHYYYALALKANNKEEEAKQVLNEYLEIAQDENTIKLVHHELNNLKELEEVKSKTNHFRVRNLEALNTKYAEYAPAYSNGFLYFSSNRQGGKTYKGTGTPFTDIYRVKSKGAKVELGTLKALDSKINDPDINEGSITISSNGKTIIYAKANNGKSSGTDEVNLYFTRYRNGEWSSPRSLSVNERGSWDSTPALSSDGTTLYFSSNRSGGYGGLDLYTAKLDRKGRWVDIRNMGSQINTPGNELFPYVGETGILYFSSDGLPGFGGLDIYQATRNSGHIVLDNLGAPVNSSDDDFGLFLFNPSRGFFTSNRKGGKGDDDIYTFVNDDPDLKIVNYHLSGTTLTPDDNGVLIPLSNTKVLLVDEEDGIIDEAFTKMDGKYKFRVYSEENYYLIAEKEEYFTTRINFSTIGKSVDRSTLKQMVTDVNFEVDLPLNQIVMQKPVVLNNIYYDLNKANIKEAAAKELNKLVTIMKDNPQITIELSSHTDIRAAHDYNMQLSQRRAESAVNYIISEGIDASRLIAKGYGETKVIIENAETELEHQQNRRTEFKVIKYNKRKNSKESPDKDDDESDRFFSDLDQESQF